MIRIVVADDHPLVAEGLVRLIERESDLRVAGRAASAASLMDLLSSTHCDVLVLDIGLPDKSGLDVLAELKARQLKVAVLILSMYPEERFAVRALRDGAAGYVTKSAGPDELITAIRKVSAGRRYISERLAEALASTLNGPAESEPHSALSNREFEVLLLLAEGGTIADIAGKLCLSESTVQTYRRRILTKLRLQNNVQLALYAARHKLIE